MRNYKEEFEKRVQFIKDCLADAHCNAIVFGNKYRSTYPEIDRELSKAEFQYLNGEYTKALKTAISCMETLFPENADEKILENA